MKRAPPWALALVATITVHAAIVAWLMWREARPVAPVVVQLKEARSLTRVAVLNRNTPSAGDAPARSGAAPNVLIASTTKSDAQEASLRDSDARASQSGSNQSGTAQSGTAQDGTAQNGTPRNSTAQNGTAQDGTPQNGSVQNGTAQDGIAQNGSAQNGTAQNGTAQDGTAQDGTAQNGTAQNGTAQNGTAQSGSAQNGSAQNGSAQNGSAQNGSAQNGSAQNGTAQNGTARDLGFVDVDALVHARLVSAAQQCYPAAAKRFKQQGTVELSFCADAGGALSRAVVKRTSGYELLDRAATECVLARASPFPSGASARCYSLPVRFGSP